MIVKVRFLFLAEIECTEQNKTECASKNADCVVLNDESACACRKGYADLNGNCEGKSGC